MTETCVNCLGEAEHLHHVVPKVYGGTDNPGNLVWLCINCHTIVHDGKKLSDRAMQQVGIQKARAEGKFKGRVPTAMRKSDEVKQLHSEGMKPNAIAETVGISRASVYRCLANYESKKPKVVYPGRKPTYTYEMLEEIQKDLQILTKTVSKISKEYGLSRQAIIRMRDKPEECLSALKKWNLV